MAYQIGEKPVKGKYCCTKCNWSVSLDDADDRLPLCGSCGAGQNSASGRQETARPTSARVGCETQSQVALQN